MVSFKNVAGRVKPYGISISSPICRHCAVPCRLNYNETAQNLQLGAK